MMFLRSTFNLEKVYGILTRYSDWFVCEVFGFDSFAGWLCDPQLVSIFPMCCFLSISLLQSPPPSRRLWSQNFFYLRYCFSFFFFFFFFFCTPKMCAPPTVSIPLKSHGNLILECSGIFDPKEMGWSPTGANQQHSRSRKINENFYSLQVHGKSTDRNFLLVQLFFFAVISPVFFFW